MLLIIFHCFKSYGFNLKTLSLFEVNEFLQRVVALNFLESVWVTAEIAQINFVRQHCYLDLVEKSSAEEEVIAQVSAVIWATDLRRLLKKMGNEEHYILEQGSEVKLQVRADFHVRYGLKLIVEDIDVAYSLGKMALSRRLALLELEKQKLLNANKMLSPPVVWQRLAVISSETSAGLLDFETHLRQNVHHLGFSLTLFPAAMQGEHLETEMIAQLEAIERQKENFDAVAIVRGGGSRLDLSGFDKLSVAIAVARCPLPVLTGIGHQIDESLCDIVAFGSHKTPTAVADFIIQQNIEFSKRLNRAEFFLKRHVEQQFRTSYFFLDRMENVLALLYESSFRNHRQNLLFIGQNHERSTRDYFKKEQQRLDFWEKRLISLDSSAILRRGFTITCDESGKILKNAANLLPDAALTTVFADGTVESRVTKLRKIASVK